jgi:hypothetical protein
VVVKNVSEIDSARGTVCVKILVCLMWNDHRLSDWGHPSLPPGLWSPQLTLSPAKGIVQVNTKEFGRDLHDAHPGDIYKLVEYDGYIYNPMDLKAFPFDSDAIDFTLSADLCQTRDGSCLNVAFKTDYRLLIQETKFGPPVSVCLENDPLGWEHVTTQMEYIRLNAAQDHCRISLHLSRKTGYYYYKVLIPLVITVLLNLAQVDLPIDNLSANLQHSGTLFLSTVALLYVVQDELPRTDFQTVIDSIILYTMYTFAFSCFIAMWAARSYNSGHEDLARRINSCGVPGLTLLYFVALFAKILPLIMQKRWAKAALLARAGNGNLISEGVPEHLGGIRRDPVNFGTPAWLQPEMSQPLVAHAD